MSETEVDRTPHELRPQGFMGWTMERAVATASDGTSVEDLAAAAGVPVEPVSDTYKLQDRIPDVSKAKPFPSVRDAVDLVDGPRQQSYGHPFANHKRIADFWNVRLQGKLKEPLNVHDIVSCMRLVKEARMMNGFHADSCVDIGGFAEVDLRVAEHIEKASNGV